MNDLDTKSIEAKTTTLSDSKSSFSEITKTQIVLSGLVAGFLGVVYETLLLFFQTGQFFYKSGIVFFPLANPVYAAGGILLTLVYYKVKTVGGRFLFATIVTSIVEYAISFLQETFTGVRSWDYSNEFLNINGRITIPFSLFWGILGLIWCYIVFPKVLNFEFKMTNKHRTVLKYVLLYAAICAILTVFGYITYTMRLQGIAPDNFFFDFWKMILPDNLMNFFYSGLVVK